jgi:glucose/arabinose dehydrogenase
MRHLTSLVVFSFVSFLLGACSGAVSAPTAVPIQLPTLVGDDGTTTAPVPTPTQPLPTDTTVPTVAQATATTAPTDVPSTATSAPTNTPPPVSTSTSFTLDIEPLVDDLRRPVYVTHAGDGSNRLFIVEQVGRIHVYENGRMNPEPFLDIQDKITTGGNEQGLLGLAFHPDYENNGLFFVNYSERQAGDNVIERYQVSSDPNRADPNSGKPILTIPGLERNHNGGMIEFGPDGYLYIGTGDGGGAGDNHGAIGNGQALNTLLGKILRIDVNADTYRVPDDNPLVNLADALPEIWSFGWRNPWRFSFDRVTGDMYLADVGQNRYEEVDFQPASSPGGENYGWRIMEGAHCFGAANEGCNAADFVLPIAEYDHDLGCSVTGGYVYHGEQYPWLDGQYIFADYCSGIVWVTARDANGNWNTRRVTMFDDTISSFGEDEAGELYVVGHNSGTIYKLTSQE